MILDVLKMLFPSKHLPWVILLLAVGWVGWKTNDVATMVQKHYTDTNRIIELSTQICKAVSKTANISAKVCQEE